MQYLSNLIKIVAVIYQIFPFNENNMHGSIWISHKALIILTLLMLEMEYSSLFGQYHACWCPGNLSRQGIVLASLVLTA